MPGAHTANLTLMGIWVNFLETLSSKSVQRDNQLNFERQYASHCEKQISQNQLGHCSRNKIHMEYCIKIVSREIENIDIW